MKRLAILHFAILLFGTAAWAQNYPLKKVLIVATDKPDILSEASGVTRDLAQLLGHFNTRVTFEGAATYKAGEIKRFDALFYIGLNPEEHPSEALVRDVRNASVPVVWMGTGISDLVRTAANRQKYGFSFVRYLENSTFDSVETASYSYTRGRSGITILEVGPGKEVISFASAVSSTTNEQAPYLIRSGNLWYVADIPFLGAKVTDRYLLFADKLHDILNEPHPESHKAMLRIEDVTPMYDPAKLREVADVLSDRGIRFLVAVVPVYVNPLKNEKVFLSDRPELVDALKYMISHGGSVVMHGTTHQYAGISATDGEFWDASNSRPLPVDDPEEFAKKIEAGINELVKNGLYPVAWETPHYMASAAFFSVISRYFSTAVEQRMSINNFDYGQYFPYQINQDLYGQKIIPENLGYVPLKPDINDSRAAIGKLIQNAVAIRQVRDGIAGCFFHPFLDIDLLKELVDGITAQGYSFLDIREGRNWVKTRDIVILTGSQTYAINPGDSFLREQFIDSRNKVFRTNYSGNRLNGEIVKKISLKPGEMYVARAVDYKTKDISFRNKIIGKIDSLYHSLFTDIDWQPARIKVVWNPAATGPAYFDQCSFIAVFRNLNMPVDTLFLNRPPDLADCNLLAVPFSAADLLPKESVRQILKYVEDGGNIVSDCNNGLVHELGISLSDSKITLQRIRDKSFPEEAIAWQQGVSANLIDYESDDRVFCEDIASGVPVAIGREVGHGRLIYLNTPLDPLTAKGYSHYPWFIEYVRQYFRLQPIVKNQNLEFYFDPGYRNNSNIEELVLQWVKQGVRRVHVAGWHHYQNYTYDYAHLIDHAHANGILVYAWFEPPQVSKKFWDDHPEWREKNYLGQNIHRDENLKASWRYPVALTDKACFRAAMNEYLGLLKKYDFDGVNIAELNFEAGRGFEDPELFTPMHRSAADQFRQLYGYGLQDIFNPASPHYWKSGQTVRDQVTAFRVGKIMELHDAFLSEISGFAKTREDFDVVITFYDTYFSPELTEYHGVNSDRIIDLRKKYAFHLQPEDPLSKWSTDPDRYLEMGKLYAGKLTDPSDLMLDLNIYKFREKGQVSPFPTLIQTGSESFQMIRAASLAAQRFTIYSESSCNPQDLPYFAYASAGMVRYQYIKNGLSVSSPCSFVLQLPGTVKVIRIDDMEVAGRRDNQFLIPAGEHRIITDIPEMPWSARYDLKPLLLSFSGNLLKVGYSWQKIRMEYESSDRTMASVDKKPVMIRVDGRAFQAEIMKGNDCYTFRLPSGRHQVEIITGDLISQGINQASIWSMNIIAVYGLVAAILIVHLFIALKFIRKKYQI